MAAISLDRVPRRLGSARNAATPHLTASFANSTGIFSIRSGTDFGSLFELQPTIGPAGRPTANHLRSLGKTQFEAATL